MRKKNVDYTTPAMQMLKAANRQYNRELRTDTLIWFAIFQGVFWVSWAMIRVTDDFYSDVPNLLSWCGLWVGVAGCVTSVLVYLIRRRRPYHDPIKKL